MRRVPLAAAAVALLAAAVALTAIPAPAAQAADQAPPGWRPDVRAAREYAQHRRGSVSFAVRVPANRMWGWRVRRTTASMSVLKAMLMVAYLNHPSVRGRPLRASDRRLLSPMIRRSANAPASAIRSFVGNGRLRRLARRAGMRRFRPAGGAVWGYSRINAADQSLFFLDLDRTVVPRHRAYAMRLLRTIVPAQRWGIARVAPRGWQLYFKGGWGSGTGAFEHQVALLRRGSLRVSVAILTTAQGTHAYGKRTLRGVAKRLLRGLPVG